MSERLVRAIKDFFFLIFFWYLRTYKVYWSFEIKYWFVIPLLLLYRCASEFFEIYSTFRRTLSFEIEPCSILVVLYDCWFLFMFWLYFVYASTFYTFSSSLNLYTIPHIVSKLGFAIDLYYWDGFDDIWYRKFDN